MLMSTPIRHDNFEHGYQSQLRVFSETERSNKVRINTNDYKKMVSQTNIYYVYPGAGAVSGNNGSANGGHG